MRSKYIVIEGIEGAGKTTISSVVVRILRKLGVHEIISTREPGGTRLGEKLRNLILDVKLIDNEVPCNKAEVLLLYAARIQLVENIIKPALANGKWVVGDRHDLSVHAYQSGGRGLDYETLITLRDLILGSFAPHLTLYLDVTPEIGLGRIYDRNNLDRIECEPIGFFHRARTRYLELALLDDTIRIIDATKSLKEVISMVNDTIEQWFWNINV